MENLIDLEKYLNNLGKIKGDLPDDLANTLSLVDKEMTRREAKKVVLNVQNIVNRYMKDLDWLFSTI